jgi:hypothetical protein
VNVGQEWVYKVILDLTDKILKVKENGKSQGLDLRGMEWYYQYDILSTNIRQRV